MFAIFQQTWIIFILRTTFISLISVIRLGWRKIYRAGKDTFLLLGSPKSGEKLLTLVGRILGENNKQPNQNLSNYYQTDPESKEIEEYPPTVVAFQSELTAIIRNTSMDCSGSGPGSYSLLVVNFWLSQAGSTHPKNDFLKHHTWRATKKPLVNMSKDIWTKTSKIEPFLLICLRLLCREIKYVTYLWNGSSLAANCLSCVETAALATVFTIKFFSDSLNPKLDTSFL